MTATSPAYGPSIAGFVAGTQEQVNMIRKPGGGCVTGSTRKLCTSFTYGRDARVLVETNGLGQTAAYATFGRINRYEGSGWIRS